MKPQQSAQISVFCSMKKWDLQDHSHFTTAQPWLFTLPFLIAHVKKIPLRSVKRFTVSVETRWPLWHLGMTRKRRCRFAVLPVFPPVLPGFPASAVTGTCRAGLILVFKRKNSVLAYRSKFSDLYFSICRDKRCTAIESWRSGGSLFCVNTKCTWHSSDFFRLIKCCKTFLMC